jgi:esterase/lipase superfamily enzyme
MQKLALLVILPLIQLACSSAPKPQIIQAPPAPSDGFLIRTRGEIIEAIPSAIKEPYAEPRSITVFVATNRDQGRATIGSTLVYGAQEVEVPSRHAVGDLKSDFKLADFQPLTLELWKSSLKNNEDWGTLVFIHGFNVDFKEAVLRASQIAYDLKFQGSVLLFSWPAGTDGGFLQKNLINKTYEHNQRNARSSIDAAYEVFRELYTLAIPIQMMIHSMGHQVVIPALDRLSASVDHPFIQELILNAPDLDPADFERASSNLSKIAKRITLFCSQNDNALLASKAMNGGKRLGSCALLQGVDVINVSEVDDPGLIGLGHGYYSSRPVLTDIYQIILGVPAERRLFIRVATPPVSENYILRK